MAKSRLSTVNFGGSKGGLATVGYTLYNTNGTINTARSTTGVTEFGTSTGVYGASLNLPEDVPVLVLWDTGEGTPRYGSEDNNVQLDSIQSETERIRLIWNSIKNQGEFFASIMDKLGLLEKNKGLVKQDIQEVVNSIKFPKQQEIKIPDFPTIKDYSESLFEISEIVKNISSNISSNKSAKAEQMMSNLSSKIDDLLKRESQFSNTQEFIQMTINKASESIKSENSSKANSLISELRKLQTIFSRFDSLVLKINDFNAKLKELDVNDKKLIQAKNAIHNEIIKMNTLVNTIAIINKISNERERSNELLLSFGGK